METRTFQRRNLKNKENYYWKLTEFSEVFQNYFAEFLFSLPNKKIITIRGGSRILSRWGGGISNSFQNFCDLFFMSTKLIFRAPPEYYKDFVLINFLCRKQIFEKRGQKLYFWALFGKFSAVKLCFIWRTLSFKFSVYWRKGAFWKKIKGWSAKMDLIK